MGRKGETTKARQETGKNVGSDVVSCVEEAGRSTRNVEGGTRNRRLERTGPCKKQASDTRLCGGTRGKQKAHREEDW